MPLPRLSKAHQRSLGLQTSLRKRCSQSEMESRSKLEALGRELRAESCGECGSEARLPVCLRSRADWHSTSFRRHPSCFYLRPTNSPPRRQIT
ncbi:hypothetical protein PHSY_006137 [Pseudozyma hubeiensis SY62]|uniref:Uncharacterized protein n=1 Tax=Pseudozyma hubeiensis (strain SY62) TaxID=1305764 RepID=R9PAW2_PSEHS|nr:hypothetical protein PHSY_006137 [Pseudozyma hubeiensis SY62]GAC98543.1 hypothetical protein PHSY_006137 [Pseudozyma hubeiensis SY62]